MKRILIYVFLVALASAAGIGSRTYGKYLPDFFAFYTGDAMWALALFLVLRLILAKSRIIYTALIAFFISASVEVSQLYHAGWIDGIRETAIGALIFGDAFKWSDLPCYAAGIMAGILIDMVVFSFRTPGRRL
ncbi:MAG: DUF2809 domain-containing protein [Bacteroidetes bacterium]|nr:DUF2809 domain-containing protein [Bacteroidota bacterium]